MSLFVHNVDIKGFIQRFPISSAIIITNTIFLLITYFTGGFTLWNLYRLGALHSNTIRLGEYPRLLTVLFLHGSVMHFLFNTFFGLAILGAGLEKLIGSIKFLLVYIITGLASSFIVVMFSDATLTVGASGAIYGILGIFLYMIVFNKHLLTDYDRTYIRNLFIINILFTFIMPRISISGHIGGLIAGFLLGFILLINQRRRYY